MLTVVPACLVEHALRRGGDVLPFIASIGLFFLGFSGLTIRRWPHVAPPSVTQWPAAAAQMSQEFLMIGTAFAPRDEDPDLAGRLTRIVVPGERFTAIRRELACVGVSVGTIFPDLDDIAQLTVIRFFPHDEDTHAPRQASAVLARVPAYRAAEPESAAPVQPVVSSLPQLHCARLPWRGASDAEVQQLSCALSAVGNRMPPLRP